MSPAKNAQEIVPATPLAQLEVKAGDKVGNFTLTSAIAGGTSGEVWRARDRHGAEIVAVKFITRSNDGQATKRATLVTNLITEFASEGIRYRSFNPYQNYISIATVSFLCLPKLTTVYQGHECIVTELLALDARVLLQTQRMLPLPNEHCRSMTWQILSGLYYLHALGIVHGDIKPENILLASKATVEIRMLNSAGTFESKEVLRSPEVKIADLDDCKLPRQRDYTPMGTPGYIAPEIMEGMDVVDKADIYALGCLVYELHTSQMFIPEQKAAFQDNPEDDLTIVLDLNAKWARVGDPDALAFIKRAVTHSDKKRPHAGQLLKHRYFGELVNVDHD
ncbi:hypothetical protein CVT26_007802 [Gymnopilus dilepis]|uniref:Protein kinase domain-containing protein n=1 Tax=Gymnopilus dilepis TaxID=231916 RepID=A0A409W7U0_9AGAR|nr:hypothetical protein CVT26_007802 [Gymnopilus dilepis]